MRALPEPTAKLLRTIDGLQIAKNLVLVGGTALALRIAHRRSEDLDFFFNAPKLPRKRISALLDELRKDHEVLVMPNVAEEQNFLNDGLELADYQQDYRVDGVKLTFFVPDREKIGEKIRAEQGVAGLKRINVADIDSLFLMKAVALNDRIAIRDFFDVYSLIEHHGHSMAEVLSAADQFGSSAESLKLRLTNATPRRDDPGIETLIGIEPSFDQLKTYFTSAINQIERAAAEAAFRNKTH